MSKSFLRLFSFLMLIIFCASCTTVKKRETGFLSNYDNFVEHPKYSSMLIDGQSLWKIKYYDSILIDPIVFNLDEKSKGAKENEHVLTELSQYFEDEIKKALSDKYAIVDFPSKNTMRLKIAVTDIAKNIPLLNIHWITKVSSAGTGGAAIEVEFVDSLDGQRLTAFVDARKGTFLPHEDGLSTLGYTKGIAKQYFKGFSRWGYTKDAFLQWARIIRERLDELD